MIIYHSHENKSLTVLITHVLPYFASIIQHKDKKEKYFLLSYISYYLISKNDSVIIAINVFCMENLHIINKNKVENQ